jgi:hypothetical protein
MALAIDRKLNLVQTVHAAKGPVHVHSMPISRAVYEDNYLVIAKAYGTVLTLGPMGPPVAFLRLRDEAKAMGIWERTQQSLMGEVYRLTNVIAPGDGGWESLPFDVAKKRGIIDEDTASEVENCICYFIFASSIPLREEIAQMVTENLERLWSAQLTALNSSEFLRSLPPITGIRQTGELQVMQQH